MEKKLNKEKAIEEISKIAFNIEKGSNKIYEMPVNLVEDIGKPNKTKSETEDDKILACQTLLKEYLGKEHKVRLEKLVPEVKQDASTIPEQEFFALYVDHIKIKYHFDANILNVETINTYNRFIRSIIYKQIPNKNNSNFYTEWSYIDEKEEYSEQTIYNQTLWSLLVTTDTDNIIVNFKLKPLLETLCGYNKDDDTIGGNINKINVTYMESNENENIIYCYNSKILNNASINLLLSDLKLISGLFGNNTTMSTPFNRIEITNIDDGVFGIKNNFIRMESPNKIELYTNPQADLDYIFEIMDINKNFSGVEHIDFVKAKNKYVYHTKMMADFKNMCDGVEVNTTNVTERILIENIEKQNESTNS